MKKHILSGLSAAVLSLAVMQSAPAFAEHEKSCPKEHQCIMKKIDELKTELKLTPEQETKLQAIRDNNKRFMDSKRVEMVSIYDEADTLSKEKEVDQTKLDLLADKAGKLRSETLKHHVMTRHDVRKVLNETQRQMIQKKMDELVQK